MDIRETEDRQGDNQIKLEQTNQLEPPGALEHKVTASLSTRSTQNIGKYGNLRIERNRFVQPVIKFLMT